MKAMLEHSQLNYHELPSMRRLRSRTSSRASPYARAALVAGVSPSSLSGHSREASVESLAEVLPAALSFATRAQVLQPVFVHTNSASPAKSTKSGKGKKAVKPVHDENTAAVRPRVNSNARRSALGWVKRVPKSSTQKENVNTSAGSLMK
jgi:serine/arginine repetitive matrix protein 2